MKIEKGQRQKAKMNNSALTIARRWRKTPSAMTQARQSNLRKLEAARRAMKQLAARERKARIASYRQYLKSRPAALTSPPRVIADGDSWFDYPEILLTGGGVINHLKDVAGVKILNTAHYGDSVQELLGVEKRQRIEALLKNPGFDILLFSGGGNDIAGDQFCLWLKPNTGGGAASAVDAARLREILGVVEDGYRDLIDIRDRCAPGCWIVTHAYDFPRPSDKGVCGLGPWLKPSLDYRCWKKATDQFAIAKTVLLGFNDRLAALEAEQKAAGKHFLHVRTQGTLNRRTDWANEIHPNAAGFTKIARAFSTALNGISGAFPKFP
jgi:hypothetical protein